MHMEKEAVNNPVTSDDSGDEPVSRNVETDLAVAEFEALLDATVDGIVVCDRKGRIIRFNTAAEKMFGFSSDEVLGRSLNCLMGGSGPASHDHYVEKYIRTGVRKIIGVGREVRATRRDGSTFPAALSVGEARLNDRIRFVGLVRDLTAEKRIQEEALRHRELMMHTSRLTTMGEMAATIAHEVNQPLSAIATYTAACIRLLNQDTDNRDDITSALEEIGAQAHRAGEVIQRMRHFTQSKEFEYSVVNIHAMILEILPLAELDANAHGVDLTINLTDDPPDLTVDSVQIQQVILNLLRNGVDAMVDTPAAQRRLSMKVYMESPEMVRFDISDRGHGVSEEARKKLFTPFFTTKKLGMGMGLAICRSIITAHGGKLDYMNNPDAGTTFFFTLPTKVVPKGGRPNAGG